MRRQPSTRCAADWPILAAPAACRAPDGRRILRFITNGVSVPPLVPPAPSGMPGRRFCEAADNTRVQSLSAGVKKAASHSRLLRIRHVARLLAGMPAAIFALEPCAGLADEAIAFRVA